MILDAVADLFAPARARDWRASLLDALQDGHGVLDDRGELRTGNAALGALLGRPAQALVGECLRSRLADGEPPAWDRAFAAAWRGEAASCATVFRTDEGRGVPAEVTFTPLRDPQGRVEAVAVTACDPVRRRGNDEMLRWIAGATAPLTGADFFHTLTRHFAAAFGLRRALIAECIDQPVTRVRTLAYWYDAEMRPDFEFEIAGTPCERTLRDGRVYCVSEGLGDLYPRARALRLDGYLGAPILDSTGQRLIGHIAFETEGPLDAGILATPLFQIYLSRASSELRRKRAEERARAHLQQLAHVGRISAMGEMASAIAHEINQPLTAVRTYAQACRRLLAAGEGPAALADPLERAAQQAERAAQIVQRLRGFLAQQVAETAPVDPNDLVREVVDLCRGEAAQCGVQLRLELMADGAACVRVDAIQVEQVVLNLVRNAIEAIQHGECLARVVTVSTRREGGEAWLSVQDSGPGVAADVAGRIFDAFFTTKAGGMGIGLALSRSIAEAHGGRLWLEAGTCAGARFHLALPAGDGAGEPA